ncbi:hypothetical protein M569_01806 [Genlisea aurea]|uniref:Uncharacterized protein n=1 Tax=Genlisea aurea TaxID=192259 RepID=S8D0Q5_9LAMI|nr:hypothetical protein M569_01806 [Genlisea aurea]
MAVIGGFAAARNGRLLIASGFSGGLVLVLVAVAAVAPVARVGAQLEEELLMESEIMVEQLWRSGYLSYAAMGRRNLPHNNRGQFYHKNPPRVIAGARQNNDKN